MKPAAFDYHVPVTLEAALALLSRGDVPVRSGRADPHISALNNLARASRALADHAALFDDIKVLNPAVFGLDNGFALGIKAQLAVLQHKGQMGAFHLIERRVLAQQLHQAVDVLHNSGLPGCCNRVEDAHVLPRKGPVSLHLPAIESCSPLDLSLGVTRGA